MANAIKAKDLPHHQARVAVAQNKGKRGKQGKQVAEPLESKTFDQLTGADKDNLLKAIALKLDLIAPDP